MGKVFEEVNEQGFVFVFEGNWSWLDKKCMKKSNLTIP